MDAIYWMRVLSYYEKQGYISNGLTIPFLIGSKRYVAPAHHQYTICELLYQFAISSRKITMMLCPNINQFVIGIMDSETRQISQDSGLYRTFGGLAITDSSLSNIDNLSHLIE